MSWISSSSSSRRMALDASSPMLNINSAAFCAPEMRSSKVAALPIGIEPGPHYLRQGPGVLLSLCRNVFVQHVRLLGLEVGNLQIHQRLGFLASVLGCLLFQLVLNLFFDLLATGRKLRRVCARRHGGLRSGCCLPFHL